MDETRFASVLSRVLDTSSNVKCLVIEWSYLSKCLSVFSNLECLRLIVQNAVLKDQNPFDLGQLSRLAPCLHRLELAGAPLPLDQMLVILILNIITRFHRLVQLVISQNSNHAPEPSIQDQFIHFFVAACEERGFDCRTIDVRFGEFDNIYVWL